MHVTRFLTAAIAVAATAAAFAQAQHQHLDGVKGSGKLPAGWQMRLDNPKAAATDLSFTVMGGGFHVMTGPAGIFYRPDTTRTGSYRVQARFQQMAPSAMPEAYGLFIGGAGLAGAQPKYTYFLIRQDGKFLVKRRDGTATPTIADWTDHAAIKKTEGATRGANTVAIAVGADTVRFMVNDAEVATVPPASVDTNGIVGLRVNHSLNMHIDGFGVK